MHKQKNISKRCKNEISKKHNKTNKGITLIALVITIIVLLILAGVTINTLFGNESVLEKASEAKEEDAHGKVKEQIQLELVNYELEKGTGETSKTAVQYLSDKGYFKEAYSEETESYTIKTEKISNVSTGKGASKEAGDVYVVEKESTENNNWLLRYYKTSSDVKDMLTISVNETVVTGGTSIEELAKAGQLHVGDYVAYTPDTEGTFGISTVSLEIDKLSNKTYKATTEKTGYDVEQTIEQEKLNWRIFSIDNNTGKVELISETPTHRALALKGSIGWLNAEEELNNACKVLYSNSKIGEARHLTMEDINKAVGFNPETEVDGYNNEESTEKAIYYPDKDGTEEYNDDNYMLRNLKHEIYTRPAGKMVDYSYYLSDEADETFKNLMLGDSNNGKWYYETSDGQDDSTPFYSHWLASRSVYEDSDGARFDVGYLCSHSGDGYVNSGSNGFLFRGGDSDAFGYDYFGSLRPIVSLKSGVRVDTEDGLENHSTLENAWKIQ